MALELPGRVAPGFGLELLEGAAFCYALRRPAGGEERPASPLPAVEELRLLGLAAQVALHRSTEADAELAFLVDLCAKTAGQAETSLWPEAQRREARLAPLARAGLIKMQSQGGTRAHSDRGRQGACGDARGALTHPAPARQRSWRFAGRLGDGRWPEDRHMGCVPAAVRYGRRATTLLRVRAVRGLEPRVAALVPLN